jgi:hypothetical protein
MISIISTPPGRSALASVFTPLLAPPFDDSNGLQSNASITVYSENSNSRPETQIGLGILLGSSDPDSLPRADSPVISEDGPFPEYPPLFLSSPQSLDEDLRLPCSPPAPENDSQVVHADLNTSSSAFSIRDWIINSSSSPAPSDALCGSLTAPHTFESAPDALSQPSDALANISSFSMALTVSPGRSSAGINPAVLTASRTHSPLTDKDDGPHGSMEAVFLQVVERICFSRSSITDGLSPSQTLIPRRAYGSPSTSEIPNALPKDGMLAGLGLGPNSGYLLATPLETSSGLASNSFLTLGAAFMSPPNVLSSNGHVEGLLVSPDTPVFNVHEGISECDLQRRANRYRRRYPGRSLDRHWLLKYAGKLNKDGKAIEDYRCYISGCAQVNKRRDHIIVHICSHVNERPFACRHWLLQFRSFSIAKR